MARKYPISPTLFATRKLHTARSVVKDAVEHNSWGSPDVSSNLVIFDEKFIVKETLLLIVGKNTEQISCMCISFDENNEEMVI